MTPFGKCDVCGVEGYLTVSCSALGGFSMAYCELCASSGAEPYGAVVGVAADCGGLSETADWFRQGVVPPSLRRAGKTAEQFDADVAAALAHESAVKL